MMEFYDLVITDVVLLLCTYYTLLYGHFRCDHVAVTFRRDVIIIIII